MLGARLVPGAVYAMALMAAFASALAGQEPAVDLATVSLENLLNMSVSSVSRRQEELRSSAAAVYVITQEDIRKSGVTDVAELLRSAPGVNVARKDSSTWAVSARGFNAEYGTKLLVVVDGRTVYDPTFSGVYWHLQNMILEDIDRIEVIRGPGATMWGANAVNGVIHITTKRATETQGGLFVAGAGSNSPGEGALRFGGSIGNHVFYRFYSRQTTRSSFNAPSGDDGGDAWNLSNVGTRLDWDPSKSDSLTIQVEVRRGVRGSRQNFVTALSPITFKTVGLRSEEGGFALARWKHTFRNESSVAFTVYHDTLRLKGNHGAKDLTTNDFDFQHSLQTGARNKLVWGFGRRETADYFPDTLSFGLSPAKAETDLTSAFVQDEITVVRNKLLLTVGGKFERSSLAGNNVQPTVRISWLPSARHAIWSSVSRAVHSASRVERGMHVNFTAFETGSGPAVVELLGQPETRSEGLIAYEAGYRYQADRKLWIDATTFYNVYDHLSTTPSGSPLFVTEPAPPHLVLPLYFKNDANGETYGAETAVSYKVHTAWTLRGSYSLLLMRLHGPAGDTSAQDVIGQTPRQQGYIGSFFTVQKFLELSGHAYFAGSLPYFGIPGYTRLDLNVAWKGFENAEFSVSGQNLLGTHAEFGDVPSPSNVTGRNFYGKVTWKF